MLEKYFISPGANKKQKIIDIALSFLIIPIFLIMATIYFLNYPYLIGLQGIDIEFIETDLIKIFFGGGAFFLYIFANLFFRLRILKKKKVRASLDMLFVGFICLFIQLYLSFSLLFGL